MANSFRIYKSNNPAFLFMFLVRSTNICFLAIWSNISLCADVWNTDVRMLYAFLRDAVLYFSRTDTSYVFFLLCCAHAQFSGDFPRIPEQLLSANSTLLCG